MIKLCLGVSYTGYLATCQPAVSDVGKSQSQVSTCNARGDVSTGYSLSGAAFPSHSLVSTVYDKALLRFCPLAIYGEVIRQCVTTRLYARPLHISQGITTVLSTGYMVKSKLSRDICSVVCFNT